MSAQNILIRFCWSLNSRGVFKTFSHYCRIAARLLKSMNSSARRERSIRISQDLAFTKKRLQVDSEFDGKYGLNTGGRIELSELSIESNNKRNGTWYQAVFPDRFRHGIESLQIDPSKFVFVDIGAGKGRALFLAEEIGFNRIVGVEFAPELVEVCEQNIRNRFTHQKGRCRIHVECVDALDYVYPIDPLVVYFFNPFNSDVMKEIAARIRGSLWGHPRPLKILYINPVFDLELMSEIPGLRRLARSALFNSYEWGEAPKQ